VERLNEKVVQIPQIVELYVDNPILVRVNTLIESFRDRPVEIPIIHQEVVEVQAIEEKIVAVEKRDVEIREVVVYKDKIVEKDNLIVKTDNKNYIETRIQQVDRYE
jgi:hypothetical protein